MQKENQKIYENYPWGVIVLANVLQFLTCLTGAFIMFKLNLITGFLYLIFLILLELSVYKEGCIHCCYFGKRCAFGRGLIAAKIFKQGNSQKFCAKEVTLKSFLPHILFSAIPVIAGILLLVSRGFNIFILIALIYSILNWVVVSPVLYGKIACPHCKQGSICCPALNFFNKKQRKNN